jgi:hypothetical protein
MPPAAYLYRLFLLSSVRHKQIDYLELRHSSLPPSPRPRSALVRPDAAALPHRSGAVVPFLADVTLSPAIGRAHGLLRHLFLSPTPAPTDVAAGPASGCVRRCGGLPSSRLPAQIDNDRGVAASSPRLLPPAPRPTLDAWTIVSMRDDKLLKAPTQSISSVRAWWWT